MGDSVLFPTTKIQNCRFKECYAEGEVVGGGAVSAAMIFGNVWIVSNSLFESCSASLSTGFGGGVLLSLVESYGNFFVVAPSFTNNSAAIGHDVLVEGQNLTTAITPNRLPFVP